MQKEILIKINGKSIFAEPGKTILAVAKENKIDIPSLCFHPDVKVKHHCGLCLVRVVNEPKLQNACKTLVVAGMEVITDSVDINDLRTKNLNKIIKKHVFECDDCVWFQHCRLLELVKRFNIQPPVTQNATEKVLQVGEMVFDQTKCIGCENCLNICPTEFLSMNKNKKVEVSSEKTKDCINCGQCIVHCPVGAMEGVGEFEELQKLILDKGKITFVQFAPAIRSSIGEEFGLANGTIATDQLVAGLKKIGFNFVFDTAVGADFTTMEESDELIERLETGKNLPAMSSCCPAWVKFVEFNYPDFIPNLCTSRSPQVMLGGIIKNYWCQKNKIDPKDVFVVSIMPCIAKKYEIKREELKINGIKPVDLVLTTRELVRLFKKNNIDISKIAGQPIDNPFGKPSGAGVIYGASGGVFESALRTAYYKMSKTNLPLNDVLSIRGGKGTKIKKINFGGRIVKVCVVNGIKNAKKVLSALQKKPHLYDAVEVMACPGGCVGGGGQSLPTNKKVSAERAEALYQIDDNSVLKCAHENPCVLDVYKNYFCNQKVKKEVLHTVFVSKRKTKIIQLKNSRETLLTKEPDSIIKKTIL
ncbi:MAG: [FeFe] hydrogenase, group A [Patescibacteria group bacterium]